MFLEGSLFRPVYSRWNGYYTYGFAYRDSNWMNDRLYSVYRTVVLLRAPDSTYVWYAFH